MQNKTLTLIASLFMLVLLALYAGVKKDLQSCNNFWIEPSLPTINEMDKPADWHCSKSGLTTLTTRAEIATKYADEDCMFLNYSGKR